MLALMNWRGRAAGRQKVPPVGGSRGRIGRCVPETVVRKVFSSSIDLVIHLDREMQGESEGPIKRQVMENAAYQNRSAQKPLAHSSAVTHGPPLDFLH